MIGFNFHKYIPIENNSPFDVLLSILKELIFKYSLPFNEAMDWLKQINEEIKSKNQNYTIDNFISDLYDRNYIAKDKDLFEPTQKINIEIRNDCFKDFFGKMKISEKGQHHSKKTGNGSEYSMDFKNYEFGNSIEQIALTETLKNSLNNNNNFNLNEKDIVIYEKDKDVNASTVLMIDISHSMILYGEDRITPAKKVALSLIEYIKRNYPRDTIDIITFGNNAKKIEIKDLINLKVGPYHTNTVAGLELARSILIKKKTQNKNIFMITDGKPTCIIENGMYYKNSFGLDKKIYNRTLDMGIKCLKNNIKISTFMIADDPYLVEFVEEFSKICKGVAYFSSLNNLGEMVLQDYRKNRKKVIK